MRTPNEIADSVFGPDWVRHGETELEPEPVAAPQPDVWTEWSTHYPYTPDTQVNDLAELFVDIWG